MSVSEIKIEISKMLDNAPDDVLLELHDYLKNLQNSSAQKIELSNRLKKILSEDKELLRRLA